MKGIEWNIPDMIITQIQGNHGTQTMKSQIGQLGKIQGIRHFQMLQGIANFFEGLTVNDGYPVIAQVHTRNARYMSKGVFVNIDNIGTHL